MDFRILGQLEIWEGSRRLTPARAKQQSLLTLLLMRPNEAVSVDELLEALWGESPPDTARTALQGHVSALRKLLGSERIATARSGYLLRVAPGELDSDRFERLVSAAGRTNDASARARLLTEALALWRGEPLSGFELLSSAEPLIARLHELRMAALEQRIEVDLELGRHAELTAELEQLVALEPLRERLRGQLMLALYRCARQAEALHLYEEGRRALSAELGLDPGVPLQRLHQQILNRDPALDWTAAPAPVDRQVRKTVTVLICELVPVHSTDPEDLDRLLSAPLQRSRSLLVRYGATVQPLFANALVGIFGASQAHEDDAERAVRAAFASRDEHAAEQALAIRIGIESGLALVTTQGARVEVTGSVLTEASRLQAAAPAGGIQVGEQAYRSTSEAIEYDPPAGGAYAAKSVRRPARISERGAEDIPFVGRERELELLQNSFDRVHDGSVPHLVTIAGDPGSGKSRVAREFRIRLAKGAPHTWREGRCLPYGDGVTFWALGEIAKAQAGILESDSPEASLGKLRSAVDALSIDARDRGWMELALAALLGVSAPNPPSTEESFIAWRRFLEAMASQQPLVMLIEDIHWADSALVGFLEQLFDDVSQLPLLLICTTRLEFFDSHPSWGGGNRNATSIALPPLDDSSTEAMFKSILGRVPSSTLVRRTGGNPLFTQELARIVAASLQAEDAVPDTIQAVIAARLDTLPPEVRETASHAAVMGEVFWSSAVATLDGTDQREADERLRHLVKGQFVRRSRTSSMMGQVEFSFAHALVRDGAYDSIPLRKRADLHELAASWIEQVAGERVSDHAEFIAHHYSAALDLTRTAGMPSAALEARTREFVLLAGDRAMRLDVGQAERYYRRALDLSHAGDPNKAVVLVHLANTAQEAGRIHESAALYEEAISALKSEGDWLTAARALMDLGRTLWRIGETARHAAAIDQAVRLLETHPMGPDLVRAWMLKGRGMAHAGQAQESLSWTNKALTAADHVGRPDLKVWCLLYRGVARKHLGDAGSLDDMREALRLGLELGLGVETGICYANLCETVGTDEGPREGIRIFQEGIEFSVHHGLVHNEMWMRSNQVEFSFQLGDWDQALQDAAEVLDWDRDHGISQITMNILPVRIEILVRRGLVAEAGSDVDRLLPLARRIGDPQAIVASMSAAALMYQAAGDLPAALALVKEVEVATRGVPGWRGHSVADCIRICVAADDLPLAETLLNGVDTSLKRRRASVLAGRAALAEARSAHREALDLYRQAQELWTAFGHRPELAYALLGEGRSLAALGKRTEACVAKEAAREIFDELGASGLAATTA